MTTSYVIEKFVDLIEIGTTFGQNWYRGHANIIGELTPGIFRKPYINPFHTALNPKPEFRFAINFKREAPSISSDLPDYSNHLEWLTLMQHHGVPTRLLDWSENIMIAVFFAVIDHHDRDAEIWSLFPSKLNEKYDQNGFPLLDNKILKFIAHEIFHNNPEQLAKEYDLDEIPKTPMAFLPPLKHPRIKAQQSCFTIHPKPEDGFAIPEILTEEKYLVRYIIPARLKSTFTQKLVNLGITYRTIFSDLDGLARSLKFNETLLGWSQPEALNFKPYTETPS